MSICVYLSQVVQRATTSVEREKKCSNDLKTAQNKANSLERELKNRNEELIVKRVTLAEERKYVTEVKPIATKELVVAHSMLDKIQGELS